MREAAEVEPKGVIRRAFCPICNHPIAGKSLRAALSAIEDHGEYHRWMPIEGLMPIEEGRDGPRRPVS